MYSVVKILVRYTLRFYCRTIHVNDATILHQKGPLLLACNHPNSFLDAIIIGSRFSEPVYFLARGDAFSKPWARRLLSALKLIPIYRLSEGRENLALNDATFEACRDVLLNNGILLIFSEGLCINDWKLRPLKKGTARIAIDAWQQIKISDAFRVLPVGINYNSFDHLGKKVKIHFDEPITADAFHWNRSNAELIQEFNQRLTRSLQNSIIESNGNDAAVQLLISNKVKSSIQDLKDFLPQAEAIVLTNNLSAPYNFCRISIVPVLFFLLISAPATAAFLLNAPLFYTLKMAVKRKTKGTVFYDSVLFGSLMITYPLYYLLINPVAWYVTDNWIIRGLTVLLPVFAWLTICCKSLLQGVWNQMKTAPEKRASLLHLH